MKPQPLLFGRELVLSRDIVVLLPWCYDLVVNIAVLVDHKAALVFRPVCPQEGKSHAGWSVCRLQRRNVTKQEGEREKLQETTELRRDGALLQQTCCSPMGSSARAVGGRRLPSTDAHDQSLCKRRSRTGEGTDRREHGGKHATE